jgi:hypothetical protein
LGPESAGTSDARTIYYTYPTSGDGNVIARLVHIAAAKNPGRSRERGDKFYVTGIPDHAKATAVENQVRQELGLPPVNQLTPASSGTMEQHFGADWKNKKIVDESDKCLCEDEDKEGP